jgi:O-antigen/teichoic acid export membrane protein
LGWNVSFVAAMAELTERAEAWERGRLLGFNDLLSGATGAALTLLGGLALMGAGVAALAIGAVALVVVPALWILRAGSARQRPPHRTTDYPRRTPCSHTSP